MTTSEVAAKVLGKIEKARDQAQDAADALADATACARLALQSFQREFRVRVTPLELAERMEREAADNGFPKPPAGLHYPAAMAAGFGPRLVRIRPAVILYGTDRSHDIGGIGYRTWSVGG